MVSMRVEGGADIEARLKAMREDVARRSWAKALRKGAGVIHEGVYRFAPRGTERKKSRQGTKYPRIASSIFTSASKAGLTPVAHVSAKAYWARFVEYGTKAHPSRMTAKSRFGPGRHKRGHAATQAHPFMRPALDQYSGVAFDTVRRELMAALEWYGGNRVRNRASRSTSGSVGGGVVAWYGSL